MREILPSSINLDWYMAIFPSAHDELELHNHPFSELVLVTKGRGIHHFLDDQREIHRGDVLFIPPGYAHSYSGGRDLTVCNLLFQEDRIPLFPGDLNDMEGFHALCRVDSEVRQRITGTDGIRLEGKTLSRLEEILEELNRELNEASPGWQSGSLALFYRFFVLLCRKITRENSSSPLLRGGEILVYMEKNYSGDLTLEDLAASCAMSVSTFQRFFKANFGRSPMTYLRELRLNKAAEFIREGELTLVEIALECGFSDASHMGRLFKAYWGVTPGQYTKER